MKRTPLKRGTKQMKRTPLKKRNKLRLAGKSTTAQLKKEIQSLLRQIVMKRDGGCILRNVRHCGGELGTEGIVFQADHLITRANSATFADHRLVVCVCRGCHYWKSVAGNLRKAEYDRLVKTLLPKERVALWEACEESMWRPQRTGAFDLKLQKIALEQELKKMP